MAPSSLVVLSILSGLLIAVSIIFIAPLGGWLDLALAGSILVCEIIAAFVLYKVMQPGGKHDDQSDS
jgi:hypothetical protein